MYAMELSPGSLSPSKRKKPTMRASFALYFLVQSAAHNLSSRTMKSRLNPSLRAQFKYCDTVSIFFAELFITSVVSLLLQKQVRSMARLFYRQQAHIKADGYS